MRIQPGHRPKGAWSFFLRATRLVLPLLIGTTVVLGTVAVGSDPACAKEGSGQAAVVVKYSEADEHRACVEFDEIKKRSEPDTISGLEALQHAGVEVTTRDFGGDLGIAVCKVENVGTDDCNFDAGFWAYYHGSASGSFEFSQVGPSNYRVPDGGLEGWVWSPAGTEAAPPAQMTFDEICAKATQADTKAAPDERNDAFPWIVVGAAIIVFAGAAVLSRVFKWGS